MVKFRDPALQQQFETQGYVVIRLLDDNDLRHATDRLSAAADGRTFQRNDWEDSYYNSMFERDPAFQDRFRADMTALFNPKLDALLEDVRYFETSLLYKPDESSELKLHQHVPLTEKPFEPSIFSWCPLVDCDAQGGTLMVVPGSHLMLRFLRTLETEEFFLDYREELTKRHAVPVPLRAGEAILFENSLLHGSCPNTSGKARPVILTIVLHEGARHVLYRHDKDGEAIVIDDDFQEVQCQTMMPGGPDQLPGRILRRLPAWADKPTLEEFEELLHRGRRASETVDPLADLRQERAPPPRRLADLIPTWIR
jgi:hypothetical protein